MCVCAWWKERGGEIHKLDARCLLVQLVVQLLHLTLLAAAELLEAGRPRVAQRRVLLRGVVGDACEGGVAAAQQLALLRVLPRQLFGSAITFEGRDLFCNAVVQSFRFFVLLVLDFLCVCVEGEG